MVITSLRVRRNRLPIVSSLPPELLARIFCFSAAIDTPSSRALGWIRVTHVCNQWRQVALDHPALWANVSLEIGSRWSEEMIQRAKLAPLIIQSNEVVSETVVGILHSHLARTAELHLFGCKRDLVHIAGTLTTSAPLMEKVVIFSLDERCVHLPVDLFGHHAPLLRSAFFHGCSIPWSSPLLRNLSYLDITLPPLQQSNMDVAPYLPSHEEFFDLLANMHQLESLSIEEYFPRYLPEATASSRMRHPVIKLPHLSALKLVGQWSDCALVLGSIEVPATSRIILDCRDLDSDRFNSMLLPILARHSGKTGDTLPMRTLLMNIHDYGSDSVINIVGWTTSDVVDLAKLWWNDTASDIGLLFQIHLRYSSPYNLEGQESLDVILQALHIQEMSILFFRLQTQVPEGYLSIFDQLESAQRLEHVACEADACSVFSTALVHTSESRPVNTRSQAVLFPRLRYVKLSANLLDIGREPRNHFDSIGQVIPVDELVEIPKRREALGVPLECLEIKMYPDAIHLEYLDQIRAAAKNTVIKVVDWY
ncbi:hypothetical protein HETIRDRAFT_314475 [Heterobasidion irregulare TC 32-1]|uniref:F-box domain-containing protein n=1 Tax=Heterobasidion irregulare (strain TC 32-1) TaxID=747525 RepID=W4KHC1_HETIT|nr:uncharacterized protein HETIRDRAFT_314475 [Heterobasidion irregulare TC 32-1]ETW84720.1 hypothetical protein HETIRDRAFT_314475 [Heterobasidion irregulare TC 32-1]